MDYSSKVREIRHFFQVNKNEFASLLNMAPTAMSEFETGSREPSKNLLMALSCIGVSMDWFLAGKGEPFLPEAYGLKKELFDKKSDPEKGSKISLLPEEENGSTIETAPEAGGAPGSTSEAGKGTMKADVVRTNAVPGVFREVARKQIPVIVEGEDPGLLIPVVSQGVSAGFGFEYDEGEVIRYLKIPSWIARRGRDLVAVPVYGDSMEPTIHQGEMIVCDSGGFKDNGLYVLRDETRGLYLCKRIAWTPGGWVIMSDNPRYEQMEVKDKDIEIVARVLAAIKEVK